MQYLPHREQSATIIQTIVLMLCREPQEVQDTPSGQTAEFLDAALCGSCSYHWASKD
jgi:hypothetical protein